MKRIVLALSVVLLVGNVSAQTGETVSLDLAKSLEIALSDNPTIKIANLEIERQDWVRKETEGNLLPSLSAQGTYTRSIVKQEMSKGLSFGADNTFTGTASLSLPLFAPTIYKTLKMNRTQMENAVEAARASRLTLINEVTKGYYNILLAVQSLEVLHTSEASIQKTVDNTEKMYQNGLASEYDLLSAQVQLSNLKPTILQTEMSIQTAKLLFKMYLGLPDEVDVELDGTLDGFAGEVMTSGNLFDLDLSQNSNLRTLDIQGQLLRNQLEIYNSQRMPTLAAFGTATKTGNDMKPISFGSFGGDDSGTTTERRSKYWWQNPVSAGLSVSIPIFSGFTNQRRAKQVLNSIEQLELQKDYTTRSITVQLRNAVNSIETARESVESNAVTVKSAQKAYDIAVTRFNAGGGTILELNSSELSLTQAKLNYSQAIYDYLAAQADYMQIVGRESNESNN